MTQGRQLELDLWEALQAAAVMPIEADLHQLWQAVEQTLVGLDTLEQLRVAAEAIAQMGNLFYERSALMFEELQASASDEGPVMPDSAFDRYVRQTMVVDFEAFIEPLPGLPRMPFERSLEPLDAHASVVGEVEKEHLLQVLEQEAEMLSPQALYEQALEVAHGEEVTVWAAAIADYLERSEASISLHELQQFLPLPLIEIWLGLLLGGYALHQEVTQLESFYNADIWVNR